MSNTNHRRFNSFSRNGAAVTCAKCDELLDAYLTTERANGDVRFYYPAIWEHLQTCKRCQHHYQTAKTLLYQPASTTPPPLLPSLPFLKLTQAAQGEPSPWRIYLGSALLGEPFCVRLTFALAYLQQCLTFSPLPHPTTALEAEATSAQERLLLRESIQLSEQVLVAQVVALWSAANQDFVQLQAALISLQPLAVSLEATLQWGALIRSCAVSRAGEVELGEAPLAPLQAASIPPDAVFAITFAPPALGAV